MKKIKRRWWLGIIAGLCAALLVAGYIYASRVARSKVESIVENRFGIKPKIGGLSIAPHKLIVSDLQIGSPKQGLYTNIERIEVHGFVPAIAFLGRSAISSLRVIAKTAKLDIQSKEFSKLVELTKSKTERKSQKSSDPLDYEVIIQKGSLLDGSFNLLQASIASIKRKDKSLKARTKNLLLGNKNTDRLKILNIDLYATHAESYQIDSLQVESTNFYWKKDKENSANVFQRILSVRRTLTTQDKKTRRERVSFINRLKKGSVLNVHDIAVFQGKDKALADDVNIEIRKKGSKLQVSGKGKSIPRGSMAWDVEIDPQQLLISGEFDFVEANLGFFIPWLSKIPWHEPENVSIDGKVEFNTRSDKKVELNANVKLKGVSLYSPKIADTPISNIKTGIQISGTWNPFKKLFEAEQGTVSLEKGIAHFSGTVEFSDTQKIGLFLRIPNTPCNILFEAIPQELVKNISQFRWQGSWGAQFRASVDLKSLEALELEMKFANKCIFKEIPALADLRRFQGPFIHSVEEPDGTLFEMETGPGRSNWTPFSEISRFMVQALIAQEDARFFRHNGFAPAEIRVALVRNLKAGQFKQGASTISMQLAKNLFLQRKKTLSRKFQEVFLTWWLEESLSKEQLLELYLNIVEFGPALYGIGPAAQHYFSRSPSELTPAQSVFLSTLLPNPKELSKVSEQGSLSKSRKKRLSNRLKHMFSKQRIDKTALEHGLAEVDAFIFRSPNTQNPAMGYARPLPTDKPEAQIQWQQHLTPAKEAVSQ